MTAFHAKIEGNDMHNEDTLLSEKIDQLSERFDSLEKSLAPILEAYNSVIFGKKFLIGLATVVGSLAAIGGGILWLINYIRHG